MREKDFETPDGALPPMDVAEFFDSLETKRMARLDGLVQQYNSIESLLIKVRSQKGMRELRVARASMNSVRGCPAKFVAFRISLKMIVSGNYRGSVTYSCFMDTTLLPRRVT